MSDRKRVIAAYQDRDGTYIQVLDDGAHMEWSQPDQGWVRMLPPLPPEAMGEVAGEATDEPPAPDLGEWPGTADVPPNTIRDVEIMTPHGACLAWYSSNDGWRAYATTRDCDPLIATRDVLRWRDLPCAVVEGGRVTGVARG